VAERSTALIPLLLLVAGCAADSTAFDRTVAALREGDLRGANSAAQKFAEEDPVRGGFLRGNIAFARCALAARQAALPEAEPFAYDVAINYCKSARDFWQRAAMSRPDWPAARRNVERALLALDELRRRKDEADQERRRERDPKPRPDPKPKPPPDGKTDEDPTLTPQLNELSPAEVLRLLETLARKEEEKRALRRARRKRSFGVERDW